MSTIQLKNIRKSFGKVKVLNELNLQVHKGQTIAIVGQSGSGKSTLLSILAGILPPEQGEVVIGSDSLWNMKMKNITRFRGKNIGIIFQDFHLIPSLTAEENIGLALYVNSPKFQDPEIIQYWLEKVGLTHRKSHYPHQLSGGEQQRVAIARALAGNPKILLADEPTGSLDEKTAKGIEQLIFSLVEETGMTTLLITHNPELARRCSARYTLHFGKLSLEPT